MNAPIGNEDPDLRYAEYALGVLEAEARAAIAEEIQRSLEAATAVQRWEHRLTPLVEAVEEVAPSAEVWVRVANTLGLPTATGQRTPSSRHASPERARAGTSLWESLSWWRGLALAASAAVIALLVVFVVPRRGPTPSLPTYMTARIQQGNGAAGWTVAVDLRSARAILVPATPPALPPGRVPELWLIPPGGTPIPVGVFSTNAPTTLPLDAALLRQLTHSDTLAVSVEPPGGSPTGKPTGPVIAQGTVAG